MKLTGYVLFSYVLSIRVVICRHFCVKVLKSFVSNLRYSKYWSIEAAALWSNFRCIRFPAIFDAKLSQISHQKSQKKRVSFVCFQNNQNVRCICQIKCPPVILNYLVSVLLFWNRCHASPNTRQKQISKIQMPGDKAGFVIIVFRNFQNICKK